MNKRPTPLKSVSLHSGSVNILDYVASVGSEDDLTYFTDRNLQLLCCSVRHICPCYFKYISIYVFIFGSYELICTQLRGVISWQVESEWGVGWTELCSVCVCMRETEFATYRHTPWAPHPSRFILQFTRHCTHISSTDKLFGLQKAFGEITYLSFHKDAISVWGVMGATNLILWP